MEIRISQVSWVMGYTNEQIWSNIHPLKYIKGSMGQWYPYSTKFICYKNG